jgi:hypothetical protein
VEPASLCRLGLFESAEGAENLKGGGFHWEPASWGMSLKKGRSPREDGLKRSNVSDQARSGRP